MTSEERQDFFNDLNDIYDKLYRLAENHNVVFAINVMLLDENENPEWDGMISTSNIQHEDILAFNMRQLSQLNFRVQEELQKENEEAEQVAQSCIYKVECINDTDIPNFLLGTIKKGMTYTVQNIISLKDGKFAYRLSEADSKHPDFNGYQSNLFKIINDGYTYSERN